MGSDIKMGSLFINPIIILPKRDTVKLVNHARYLNSITDFSNYSWFLEPVQVLLTRPDGVYYSRGDLVSAYNQVPLSEDTKKLTSFVVGGKQYMFERGFYGLRGLPNFFSRIMTIHFAEMIAKKQAVTYIEDVILQAKTKVEMWKNLESYFQCLISSGLRAKQNQALSEKSSIPWTHCFRQRNSTSGQKGPRPKEPEKLENKRVVMRILRSLGFYCTFINSFHVDSKPSYELLRVRVPFEWTKQQE